MTVLQMSLFCIVLLLHFVSIQAFTCTWCPGPGSPTPAPVCTSCCTGTCCVPSSTCDCTDAAAYGGSVKACCSYFHNLNISPPNCNNNGGGGGGGGGGGSSHGGVSVPKPKPKVTVVSTSNISKSKPKPKVKVPDRLSPTHTPPHFFNATGGPGPSSGASAAAGVALGSAVVVALAYGWSRRRVVHVAEEDHSIITRADVVRLERSKRRADALVAPKERSETARTATKKGWARRFVAALKSKPLTEENKANGEPSETPYESA